jgi:hypothetical protein
MAWRLEEAERQPVLMVWEDLHCADPSSLELLGLCIDHVPTARLLLVLTFRPEFHPPWPPWPQLTPLTLTRVSRQQSAEMVARVAGGKALPAAVLQQIVAQTDGVPLFVEELTKTVLESGLLQAHEEPYALTGPLPPLAIPATLQDALMARLDRLATVKVVAQLGATLGRTFTYELLQAVSHLDELELWRSLVQLVKAEVLYQRGELPHATYTFKHALLQEAASQSLLRSTRRQYHQRIAPGFAERLPETVATQPELLAHHYPEAGLVAQAVGYWYKAGQRARALGKCGSDRAPPQGAGDAHHPPRHAGAPPAGAGLADHPRPGVDGHQGPCGSGHGSRLAAGARAVPAGRGDPTALPSVGRPGDFLYQSGRAPDRPGAGRAATQPGPACPSSSRPRECAYHAGQCLVLPARMGTLPARIWSRASPSPTPSSTAPRASSQGDIRRSLASSVSPKFYGRLAIRTRPCSGATRH